MGERVTVYMIIKGDRVVMIWDTELAERNATQLHDFIGWWKDMEPWDEIIKVALAPEGLASCRGTLPSTLPRSIPGRAKKKSG